MTGGQFVSLTPLVSQGFANKSIGMDFYGNNLFCYLTKHATTQGIGALKYRNMARHAE